MATVKVHKPEPVTRTFTVELTEAELALVIIALGEPVAKRDERVESHAKNPDWYKKCVYAADDVYTIGRARGKRVDPGLLINELGTALLDY
jgi:hypothetical protein